MIKYWYRWLDGWIRFAWSVVEIGYLFTTLLQALGLSLVKRDPVFEKFFSAVIGQLYDWHVKCDNKGGWNA